LEKDCGYVTDCLLQHLAGRLPGEKHWVENAQESGLERVIAGFAGWLREGAVELPGLSEDEAEGL